MKIAVMVGSVLAIFLILMMPNVKTVEYTQVTSSVAEKISGLAERIGQRLERVNEKQLRSLSKGIDVERLRVFLDDIKNNGNGICLSCEYNFVYCLKLLILFLVALYFIIIGLSFIIPVLIFGIFAYKFWEKADQLGCVWATIAYDIATWLYSIIVPPSLNQSNPMFKENSADVTTPVGTCNCD
jgi:hypothetical protein